MCKQITSKVTLILLVLGVMSNPFKSYASPVFETAKASVRPNPTNKLTFATPASTDAGDVVIDDLVIFNFSSTTSCTVSSTLKKYAGESMPINVGSNTWRAKFTAGGQSTDIALSYNVQTDHLTFNKVLGSNVTYTVDPNGEFIRFFINGNPFFSIEDMKTCDQEMCGRLNFSTNYTVLRLYSCNSSGGGSNALVAKVGSTTQHTDASKQDDAESARVDHQDSKKSTVATHAVAPNPFTNKATISYNLVTDAQVNVTIYNSIGQKVDVLVNQRQAKGLNSVEWQATDSLKGGLYFYEITANNERMVGKLIKQ
jgi:hypothetical protein